MSDDEDADFRDALPYPLSLRADDPQTSIEIARMREAAEAVHGRETIDRLTREYATLRAELQSRPLDPSRKGELLAQTQQMEHEYGYEVLTGVPRITGGDHPIHRWKAQLEDAPDTPPTQ